MRTNTALDARVAAVVELAERHGWDTATDDELAVPGCTAAATVTAAWPIDDGSAFVFAIALGVSADTGRVVTLEHPDYQGARVLMFHVDERTPAGRLALALPAIGRYWWSRRAGAWRAALTDPLDWTGYTPAAPVPAWPAAPDDDEVSG